jgi:cell division protein FtsZ
VDEAARIITEACDPEANIIFGATINENYTGEIKITVVATGFNEETNQRYQEAPKTLSHQFGKKMLGHQAPMHNAPSSQGTIGGMNNPNTPQSELDVPAFLRNKMK